MFSVIFSAIISSPAVSDEAVYFSSSSGSVHAIEPEAQNWLLENRLMLYWKALYMYSAAPRPPPPSGSLWFLRLGARITSSPAVVDDILYTGVDNKLLAIDINSHEKHWVFEAGGMISSSPAITDTTIYVGSEDGHLYAVDITTGQKLWGFSTEGQITASPAVAEGMVYVGSHDGNLYAIE